MGSSNSFSKTDEYVVRLADSTHTCRICYEEFDDKEKVARLLCCGHSFCTKCLLSLVKFGQNYHPSCPECRKITRQSVMSLPVNFQFMQILRKMNLTVEQPEVDDAVSTTATVGQDGAEAPVEQPSGELEALNDPQGDESIASLLEQMQRLARKLKDKASQEVFHHQVSLDDPYHWSDCLDKIEELESTLGSVERSYELARENRDYYDDDDDDDDDYEDDDDDPYAYSDDSEAWDDQDIPEIQSNAESLENRWDGTMAALSLAASIAHQFADNNSTDDWARSDEASDYGGVFERTVNPRGQNVLKCSTCECFVPYGSEISHLGGRRHDENTRRRTANRPIVRRIAQPGARRFHANRASNWF